MGFVLSPLIKYTILVVFVIAVVCGIYYAGASSVQSKWDLAKAEVKTQIVIQHEIQDKITYLTNTVYVDRIKEVKIKGDTITKIVKEYVTNEDNNRCIINNGALRVLDAASTNTIPGSPDGSDEGPSGLSLSGLVENTASNYNIANQYIEQNRALKQWLLEQKQAGPK